MTTTRPEYYSPRPHGPGGGRIRGARRPPRGRPVATTAWPSDRAGGEISPLRKAAIVLVSLEQSLASQLLSHLDRSAVEMVTWEIARLDRIDPAERAAVLEEFYGLGLRRLCFVFDDLVKMGDADIRAAFHEEDLETWALAMAGAAATVRAKVLGALSAASAEALSSTWITSARSGSPTPRRPSSRSPIGCGGSTTAAGSACRSPMAATKSSFEHWSSRWRIRIRRRFVAFRHAAELDDCPADHGPADRGRLDDRPLRGWLASLQARAGTIPRARTRGGDRPALGDGGGHACRRRPSDVPASTVGKQRRARARPDVAGAGRPGSGTACSEDAPVAEHGLRRLVAGDGRHRPGAGGRAAASPPLARRFAPGPPAGGRASRRPGEPLAQALGLHAPGRPARAARRGRSPGAALADHRAGGCPRGPARRSIRRTNHDRPMRDALRRAVAADPGFWPGSRRCSCSWPRVPSPRAGRTDAPRRDSDRPGPRRRPGPASATVAARPARGSSADGRAPQLRPPRSAAEPPDRRPLRPDLAGPGRPAHGDGLRPDQHRPDLAAPGPGEPPGARQPGPDRAGAAC